MNLTVELAEEVCPLGVVGVEAVSGGELCHGDRCSEVSLLLLELLQLCPQLTEEVLVRLGLVDLGTRLLSGALLSGALRSLDRS